MPQPHSPHGLGPGAALGRRPGRSCDWCSATCSWRTATDTSLTTAPTWSGSLRSKPFCLTSDPETMPATDPQPHAHHSGPQSWEFEARASGPRGQLLSLSGCVTTSKSGGISSHRFCICHIKVRSGHTLGSLGTAATMGPEASPPPPSSQGLPEGS